MKNDASLPFFLTAQRNQFLNDFFISKNLFRYALQKKGKLSSKICSLFKNRKFIKNLTFFSKRNIYMGKVEIFRHFFKKKLILKNLLEDNKLE